jgi:hypothetical protein
MTAPDDFHNFEPLGSISTADDDLESGINAAFLVFPDDELSFDLDSLPSSQSLPQTALDPWTPYTTQIPGFNDSLFRTSNQGSSMSPYGMASGEEVYGNSTPLTQSFARSGHNS